MSEYTPHSHPFQEGEIVRHITKGTLIRLENINPDPDFDVTDETWADASSFGGYGDVELDGPHEIEKFDWNDATVPKIAAEVSSTLHAGFGDNLEVYETELDGDAVLVSARWDGVAVTFAVAIYDLEVSGE